VSGDGVDQDDYVTNGGTKGFEVPANIRADQIIDQGVRLPYFKFPRIPPTDDCIQAATRRVLSAGDFCERACVRFDGFRNGLAVNKLPLSRRHSISPASLKI